MRLLILLCMIFGLRMDIKDLADLNYDFDIRPNRKLEKIIKETDLLENLDEKKLEEYFL